MKNLAVALLFVASTPFAAPASLALAKRAPAKGGNAPNANADEISKLKGDIKWGMSVDQVADKIGDRIDASYADDLKKTAADPTKQERIRKQMHDDELAVKKNYIKFDGQKTGYDVSIIDQEFTHRTNESMLTGKESSATRYYFFAGDKLYKMFIAFDKDMLEGKSFQEFGKLMQARFGTAREVYVDSKKKAGTKHELDHFEWSSKSGDGLRLVDRSEFYGVYCLVVFDPTVAKRLAEARASLPKVDHRDNLVEAVTAAQDNDRDTNDNIVDRIVGKEARKPGDEQHADIVVPSVASTRVHAPTAAEVNRKEPASSTAPSVSAPEPRPSGKAVKVAPSSPATKGGLEL